MKIKQLLKGDNIMKKNIFNLLDKLYSIEAENYNETLICVKIMRSNTNGPQYGYSLFKPKSLVNDTLISFAKKQLIKNLITYAKLLNFDNLNEETKINLFGVFGSKYMESDDIQSHYKCANQIYDNIIKIDIPKNKNNKKDKKPLLLFKNLLVHQKNKIIVMINEGDDKKDVADTFFTSIDVIDQVIDEFNNANNKLKPVTPKQISNPYNDRNIEDTVVRLIMSKECSIDNIYKQTGVSKNKIEQLIHNKLVLTPSQFHKDVVINLLTNKNETINNIITNNNDLTYTFVYKIQCDLQNGKIEVKKISNHKGRARHSSESEIIRLLKTTKLTCKEIADRCDCAEITVKRTMKRHNISRP